MASQSMKREVIFVLMFTLLLSLQFLLPVSAAEEEKVELGYSCLETRINQTGCSSLSFEDKVFSYLATGECGSELSADNSSNQCWPKSGCRLKSTAQAILALNNKVNTTLAENWLLRQTASPSGIDWYLEIEVPSGETTCTLVYPGSSPRTITVREDKTLSSGAGNYLTLSAGGYWLKINQQIYNKEIYISCERQFITTLLFMRTGSSTVHVSENVHGSGAGGNVTEKVDSVCFAQSGTCNYEGSLWAALVLASLDHDEEIQKFLPYLITMKDDISNSIYIPESFLYYLTNKFRTDLLLKQKYSSYWEESGNRYYDTALALLPFSYDDSNEKSNSKEWLLSVQQKSGCWNNGNIRDTAFLLYSAWPKNPFSPIGNCQYDSDCPQVDCKYSWCENGACMYEYDGSCIEQECTKNSDCPPTDYSENYCDDNSIYRDTYTYSCDTSEKMCKVDVSSSLVETCSSSDKCEDGECIQDSCSWINPCNDGYDCVSGTCVEIQGECQNTADCEVYNYDSTNFCSDSSTVSKTSYTYYCNTEDSLCYPNADETIIVDECSSSEVCDDSKSKCVTEETECSWLFNPCDSGYDCIDGTCVPEGECATDSDCPYEECMSAKCTAGTCLWEYTKECEDNDYCCNPGCNYTNDNDCGEAPQCTSNSDCSDFDYQSNPFCGGNNWEDVYLTFYNYTCENEECKESWKDILIQDCSPSQDCYDGECYGGTVCECEDELDCSVGYTCVGCECVEKSSGGNETCSDWWDCDYDEDCINGICVPYACDEDSDCTSGTCIDGECVSETSDCEENLYYCRSQASCDASGGNIMQDYSCSGGLMKCCDVDASLLNCDQEGGTICSYDKVCSGGVAVDALDIAYDETCCVGGTCTDGGSGGEDEYCTDNGGTCRDEGYCQEGEDEKSYICDYSYQSCCIASTAPGEESKGKGWIIIVILLILIILAVLGIVFRDKVRTEWIKIKDKFNGKKPKKKIELPLSMQPNPNGRILPRRILPPGQQSAGLPQNSRFPMRTMGPPISRPPMQGVSQQTQVGKQNLPQQTKPSTQQTPGPQKPTTPGNTAQTPAKKPEVKPRNGDLDEVLKKLKEMGEK